MQSARVIGRASDGVGVPIGEYDPNLIMNTRVYDVMFPNGSVQQYSANLIAENMYSQVDSDGHSYALMDEIIDHQKKETAVDKVDGFMTDQYGRKKRKYTTKGWDFPVNWKDGTQSWIPLKDIKESNPIEVAEYVKAKDVDNEPAFA